MFIPVVSGQYTYCMCHVGKHIVKQRECTEKCATTHLCSIVQHTFRRPSKRSHLFTRLGDISSGDPQHVETSTSETSQSHSGLCLRLAHLEIAIFNHFPGLFRTFTLLSLNHFWCILGIIVQLETRSPPKPQFSCRKGQIQLWDLVILLYTILSHPELP